MATSKASASTPVATESTAPEPVNTESLAYERAPEAGTEWPPTTWRRSQPPDHEDWSAWTDSAPV